MFRVGSRRTRRRKELPTRNGYPEGVPSWTDLSSPDVKGAESFYNELFGWDYYNGGTEEMPYTMATRKGLAAAGIGQAIDPNAPSVWSTYFAVDDADATIERILANGGSMVMDAMDVFDFGRMAFAADPTGAVFGIWQAKDHIGAGIVNEHGALNWNELQTDDLDAALAFYGSVFGHAFETAQTPSGPYTSISVGDRVVAGAMPKPTPEIPNNWGAYFAVDNTPEAIETATSNGGTVTFGPMEVPNVGVFAGLVDPFGAHVTVIQLASPVD